MIQIVTEVGGGTACDVVEGTKVGLGGGFTRAGLSPVTIACTSHLPSKLCVSAIGIQGDVSASEVTLLDDQLTEF